MIVETNLIELNKITLKNYNTYNEKIKYEIYKISTISKNRIKPKGTVISAETRKQEIKNTNMNII